MPMPDDDSMSRREKYALARLKKLFSAMSKDDLELYALCQTVGATVAIQTLVGMGVPDTVIQIQVGMLLRRIGVTEDEMGRVNEIATKVAKNDDDTAADLRRIN